MEFSAIKRNIPQHRWALKTRAIKKIDTKGYILPNRLFEVSRIDKSIETEWYGEKYLLGKGFLWTVRIF